MLVRDFELIEVVLELFVGFHVPRIEENHLLFR